jgi:hypothetical protein
MSCVLISCVLISSGRAWAIDADTGVSLAHVDTERAATPSHSGIVFLGGERGMLLVRSRCSRMLAACGELFIKAL